LSIDSVSFLPLQYIAGSELCYKTDEQGKIIQNVYLLNVESRRGLGSYTYNKIEKQCNKGHREYYLRPSFILRLLIKSLKNDDLGFINFYLSLLFSKFKRCI
jgi:hypothetical protein